MPERFLYLTTKGRKTGAPRQIEIWFVEHDGRYYMVSEAREQSGWVKNLQHDPAVTFSVGTRQSQDATLPPSRASARLVRPEEEPDLAKAISALMDEKYRWSDGLIVELTLV